ncbi:protein ILRUN isoform X2 [Wyeomyia smithii]|uniref:protein ILRUN isoform X2 n=1 Tax=Wyeomyia smithii TaxID=174621 RepID=UPI002467C3A3|nr:protein ILRUN isoform X2 [Wyeomyia smithii]
MEDSLEQITDDIEQNFLTQFSSMVTTDKDDLIKQFQTLGENLNYSTAAFFLDMSNWNLQAAVGCYFDFMFFSRLPSVKIISDLTIGKDEKVTPNTQFQLSWQLQNNGETSWPVGSYLRSELDDRKYDVPSLAPNDTTIITVDVTSPPTFGFFTSKWFLCTPYGSQFGDSITSNLDVCENGTLAITQHLSQLQTLASFGETIESTSVSRQNASYETLEDTDMWG